MPSKAVKARKAALANGAPRGKRPKTSNVPARLDPGRAVLDTIGREHMTAVLRALVSEEEYACPTTPEARLLAYLESREHIGDSLTLLMRNAGLTLNEIVDMTRNYDIATGVLRASAHVPDVLEDIAVDAKSRLVTCPTCKGEGVALDVGDEATRLIVESDPELAAIVGKDVCGTCDGVGELRKLGSTDARKILLETMGVINRKTPAVQIDNRKQTINNVQVSAPEDVASRVRALLDA